MSAGSGLLCFPMCSLTQAASALRQRAAWGRMQSAGSYGCAPGPALGSWYWRPIGDGPTLCFPIVAAEAGFLRMLMSSPTLSSSAICQRDAWGQTQSTGACF